MQSFKLDTPFTNCNITGVQTKSILVGIVLVCNKISKVKNSLSPPHELSSL